MADATQSPPSQPSFWTGLANEITVLAAAESMTPAAYLASIAAQVTAPLQKQIADDVFAMISKKFTSTAEVSKGNDDLQNDFPDRT